MSAEDKITPNEGHNYSAQQGVALNPDPVLDLSNEHTHSHTHHATTTTTITSSGKEEMMFATSTDKYAGATGTPDYKVQQTSSRDDEESGGVGDIRDEDEKADSRKWSMGQIYKRYRLLFHLFIWGVWTA